MRATTLIAGLLVSIVVTSAVQALPLITITQQKTASVAHDPDDAKPFVYNTSTDFPTTDTLTVTGEDYHSETILDFIQDSAQTTLSWDFHHTYAATYDSHSDTSVANLVFTTGDNPMAYSLSGEYGITEGNGQHLFYYVGLVEKQSDADAVLFSTEQVFFGAPAASVTLGEGDEGSWSGNLTGTLAANTSYQLDFYAFIHNTSTDPSAGSASAAGNVLLELSPIPEPSSIIGWCLIGLTFAGIGWRRRRKT